MFVGHFGVALGARALDRPRSRPRSPSLGTFVMAAIALDLVWPVFVLLGVERVRIAPGITRVTPLDFESYPWSHSLLMACVWGTALGGAWLALARERSASSAALLGAVVVSHWVLDWITHRPDMPIGLSGPRVGLGLWNSLPGTIAAEALFFLAGVALYARSTRAVDRRGKWYLASWVLVLVALYAGAVAGPPPPDAKVVAWSGIGAWIFVAWAYGVDRHRERVHALA